MPEPELPVGIVAQFRAASIERLGRIESAWAALSQRVGSSEVESELFHDVHTLKGEARLVGFADVVLIAQRLEDLLIAARRRRYRVGEDVDVLVTMAIQFIRMLLRKRAGASQGGIDINGFLKQIDEVLAEWPRQSEGPDSISGSTRTADQGRVSAAVRQRLGATATQVFLELLATINRPRLRRAWESLVGELAQLDAVAVLPLVRRHASSAKDLAAELGKELDVVVDGPDVRVGVEVLEAIHSSLLHTLRNAVDHGIEPPAARLAAGKPRRGSIELRFRLDADAIELVVKDDGGGVDTDAIRARAKELGFLAPDEAEAAPESTLLGLAFAPGLSIRESASMLSGRGIGLDAVRAGIQRLGGTVTLTSRPGAGAAFTFRLPQLRRVLEVHRIPSTRPGLAFAVPTTWTVRVEPRTDALDPAVALGLDGYSKGNGPVVESQIVLARDGEEHAIAIGGPVTRVRASRICPTSPDEALEVVAVGAEQLLLMRPDAFFASPDSLHVS